MLKAVLRIAPHLNLMILLTRHMLPDKNKLKPKIIRGMMPSPQYRTLITV